ncbi:histone deacetylase [Venenivibrio stagnispumantis]|uniref:Acetoin utilization deacetylase AcuC n=1 Tax=Venenivibrio stagnispumantis TaxID=407998 RepID=A0AA46AFD5_9AQUI|nr:histone deacetylase [Venenivibrio stagnispumantis]MCW4573833.1 histone deacetylase [Venenivibrio stagnispumantis]SMP18881.1 Acetoin utilization deacetylase AcuC [Venenivibrio stagnispumantis]
MAKVGYIYDDIYLKHDTGEGHPERKERLISINEHIKDLKDKLIFISPRKATVKEITLIHDTYYPQEIMDFCSAGGGYLDPDTKVSELSYEAATYAVGAGLEAIDKIKEGKVERVFAAVRPPGHHAEKSNAMGFCIFNNIAIAARYAQTKGYEKVFIIDFDAHHGNGTQRAFYEDDTVFYFSTHEYPFYPGTGSKDEKGAGKGYGYTYNVPLPAGTGDELYLDIYQNLLPELVKDFKPDIILVSAGYDLHKDDPLTYLEVSTEGIGAIVEAILKTADVPFLFMLEGGYNLKALGESVRLTIEKMVEI